MSKIYDLDKAIRKVKDFPKPGILFYDITSILINPEAFNYCIDKMVELYKNRGITAVAAIESRGFLFASPFANRLGLPIILIRKKGKLPGETYKINFTLEYGEDTIEIHKQDIKKGMNVLLVDDLIATGGTLAASVKLIEKGGAKVDSVFSVVGLPFLNYDKTLSGVTVNTLINYNSEKA
jgi:adenine phosphoribosyltransferase